MFLPDEVDPKVAENSPNAYDLKAYYGILNGEAGIFKFELTVLNLDDSVVGLMLPEYVSLFREVSRAIDTARVSRNYAYIARTSIDHNTLLLQYLSSYNYYDRFDQLTQYYKQLVKSLNDMLWDSIEYIKYKAVEYRIEEIKNKIFSFYSRIPPKYLDVTVYDNEVFIYAPMQLIGRIIGKKGATINQLQQLINRRIKVYEAKYLTDLYSQEHPEIPGDPEVLKLVGEVIKLLGELEKKGVTVQQVLKMKETMESPDDYEVEGEAW
jgi:hypothetical protein